MKNFLSILLISSFLFSVEYEAIVYLKNGSVIHGTIIEEPGFYNYIKIKSEGKVSVYQSFEIDKITKKTIGKVNSFKDFNINDSNTKESKVSNSRINDFNIEESDINDSSIKESQTQDSSELLSSREDEENKFKKHNLSIGMLDDKTGVSMISYTYHTKSKASIYSILSQQIVAHLGFSGFMSTASLGLEYNITKWAQIKVGGFALFIVRTDENKINFGLLPFMGFNFGY